MPAVLVGLLDDGVAGGSDAVFADGEPVVDVWVGVADAGRTIPSQRETIANVSSVTKTMTALCALILADLGEIGFRCPYIRACEDSVGRGRPGSLYVYVHCRTVGV